MPAASTSAPDHTSEHRRRWRRRCRQIVGRRHVLDGPAATLPYRRGYRFGGGEALAVIRPGSLVELWRVLQACVEADVAILMQAANTGLTGGSTPGEAPPPGGVAIISTTRLKGVHVLGAGEQVVCLPGATLHELETALGPLGREPHSVIGSTCIGASVHGGVCNNSGGALVRRGPAYTELALFAQLDADGRLQLVNHLGIDLGRHPEEMLLRLERGAYGPADVDPATDRMASDTDYARHVRDVAAPTPARFNADPRRLFEASGCAGKLAVFAVRLDTYPMETGSVSFYLGANDPAQLTQIRRDILGSFAELPISAEYIHRDAFDIAAVYGKDTFLAIQYLGTENLPRLFRLKAWVDRLAGRLGAFGEHFSDRLLQTLAALHPQHLPARLLAFRDAFEHHLILTAPAAGAEEARRYLSGRRSGNDAVDVFECTPREAAAALRHRFAVASAAVRYRAIHADEMSDIVALDIALPRSASDWLEELPAELAQRAPIRLYYGHFLCHVFHQDYLAPHGEDVVQLKHDLLEVCRARGAMYPAEHNVGRLYAAPAELADFYRSLDPTNRFNPGLGQTSRNRMWRTSDL